MEDTEKERVIISNRDYEGSIDLQCLYTDEDLEIITDLFPLTEEENKRIQKIQNSEDKKLEIEEVIRKNIIERSAENLQYGAGIIFPYQMSELTNLAIEDLITEIQGWVNYNATHFPNTRIRELDFSRVILGTNGVEKFCNKLQDDPNLFNEVEGSNLNFSDNLIGDAGAIILAKFITTARETHHFFANNLDVSFNLIGDDGAVAAISRAITYQASTNHSIDLNLSNNQIGDGGAEYLARTLNSALENNPELQLNLRLENNRIGDNGIGDNGIEHLVPAIINIKPIQNIICFDLSGNKITMKGVETVTEHILKMMETDPKTKEYLTEIDLDFSNNEISNENAEFLYKFLSTILKEKPKTRIKLNFSNNKIGNNFCQEVIQPLLDDIEKLETKVHIELNFSNNQIEEEKASFYSDQVYTKFAETNKTVKIGFEMAPRGTTTPTYYKEFGASNSLMSMGH